MLVSLVYIIIISICIGINLTIFSDRYRKEDKRGAIITGLIIIFCALCLAFNTSIVWRGISHPMIDVTSQPPTVTYKIINNQDTTTHYIYYFNALDCPVEFITE